MIEEDVQIGDVRLIRGDCLDVMPLIERSSVNAVIADLPFAITANAWDVDVPIDRLWHRIKQVCTKQSWAIFFGDMKLAARLYVSNPKAYRHDICWHKVGRPSGYLHAKHAPLRAHELILAFAGSRGPYNPQMTKGKAHNRHKYISPHAHGANFHPYVQKVNENKGTRYPISVLAMARPTGKQLHPTEKPVHLLSWLVSTYTDKQHMVLDPVAGSGGAAIACLDLGRKAICIEKDKGYFDIMVKRVTEHHAKMMGGAA